MKRYVAISPASQRNTTTGCTGQEPIREDLIQTIRHSSGARRLEVMLQASYRTTRTSCGTS